MNYYCTSMRGYYRNMVIPQLWCEVATLQMQDTLLHHDIHSPGRYRWVGNQLDVSWLAPYK